MTGIEGENGRDPIEVGAERIARDAAEIKASREREIGIDAEIAELDRVKQQKQGAKLHEQEVRRAAEKDIAEVDADLTRRDQGNPAPAPKPAPAPSPAMPPQPPRPQVG